MIVGFSRKFSAGGGGSPPGSPFIWLKTTSLVGFNNGDDIYNNQWPNDGSDSVDWGGHGADGSSNNPTYNTSVTLNGHPSAEFDAASSQRIRGDSSVFTPGWTAATVYFVGKLKNDPPGSAPKVGLWTMGNVQTVNTSYDHGIAFPWTDGSIYDNTFTTVRKTVGNPTPSLASGFYYGVKSTANSWEARLNGSSLHSTGTNTFNDAENATDALRFGETLIPAGDGGGAVYFDGYLWELIIYSSVLDATDTATLESYFATRYGI